MQGMVPNSITIIGESHQRVPSAQFFKFDQPPFRAMIEDLARMRRNGACLELTAIDAGNEENTGRDEWMEVKLAEQVSQAPVLALLGNLHALKKVDWHWTVSNSPPYVAQILVSQGYRIHSFA